MQSEKISVSWLVEPIPSDRMKYHQWWNFIAECKAFKNSNELFFIILADQMIGFRANISLLTLREECGFIKIFCDWS